MSLSRGYVSFQSVLIDEMASKYVDMLPKDDRLQLASKRNPWHITILTKDELENLSAAKKSELYQKLELFAENLDDLVDIGLGKGVENGSVVYFVVIWWPVVQEIRELLGLGKKQVHLTLAYNDCDLHSVDKGFSSLVRVGKDVDEDKVKQLLTMSRRNFDEESLPELLEYLLSFTDSQRADVYDLLAMHSLRNKNYAKCEMACIQLLDLEASLRAHIRIADYFFAIKSWRLACLAFFMTLEWGPFQDAILIHIGDRLKKCVNKIGTIWPALVTEDDLKELKAWRHVLGSFHDFIEIPQELLFPMLTEIVLPDKCELLVETRNHFCLIKGEEKDDLRMPRFFTWLVHGLVAGMSTPRNAQDIILLERLGIETVVSLTKEDPLPEEWFSTTSVKHHFFPVENYGVPESFDPVDYYTQLILRSAHSMQMEQRCGKGVLVHCGGGKGRAGTFLACYLLRFGLEFPMLLCSDCIKTVEDERMMCNNSGCAMAQPPVMSANEAIALLRDLRPGSIETEVQERYIQRYGSYCWKRLEQRADRKAEPSDKLTIIGKLPSRPPLILCCGFPASGKSWFSKTLTSGGYTRISQDDLGSRSACENALSICVRNGEAVVLDRCNPTREDRKMWWKLAGQPAQSVCVHFSADSEICYARAQRRLLHPTLSNSGRVRAALEHFQKEMQAPSLNEPFVAVCTVPSFEAAHELLQKLGVSTASQTSSGALLPAELKIFKYPRTSHLLNLGSASRDDLLLGETDRQMFFNPPQKYQLTLEEKVDGANLGIRIDSQNKFLVQNRSHFVNSSYHTQFKALDKWLSDNSTDLFKILKPTPSTPSEKFILFGEWLAATHSISYSQLPDRFLAFDLYDTLEEKFLSRKEFIRILGPAKINRVRPITFELPLSEPEVTKMVQSQSEYYDGPMEGIYFRLDEGNWLKHRSKVVRVDFLNGNKHWSKGMIQWNTVRNAEN